MREIKFRAWHKTEKSMLQADDDYGTKHSLDCVVYFMQGQPVELMQFTGLLDKQGKEIYEGDIVRIFKYESDYWDETELIETEHPQQVKMIFNGQYFPRWTLCDLYIDNLQFVGSYDKLEIIGNIYENKDLLK